MYTVGGSAAAVRNDGKRVSCAEAATTGATLLLPLQLPTQPLSSLRVEAVAVLRGHASRVWCVAWSPTARLLASSSADCSVRLWGSVADAARQRRRQRTWTCLCTLAGEHTRTVRHVSWSPSGAYVACASFDHTATVWHRVQRGDDDGDDGNEHSQHAQSHAPASSRTVEFEVEGVLDGHESEVKCVSWLTDSTLATCARDHNVWVWDRVEEGEYECAGILTGHRQDVKHCLWLLPPPLPHATTATATAASSNNNDGDDGGSGGVAAETAATRACVLSCSYDDTIRMWTDAQCQDDWRCVQTLTEHTATVWAMAVQRVEHTLQCVREADARGDTLPHPLLCSCDGDGGVRFWRRRCDGSFVHAAHAPDVSGRSVYAVDWAPHGAAVVACAGGDNTLTLLSLHATTTRGETDGGDARGVGVCVAARVENAHEADVNSVSFAYDGRLCADGAQGGDLDNNNDEDKDDDDEDDEDEKKTCGVLLASGGDDAVVRIWRVVCA